MAEPLLPPAPTATGLAGDYFGWHGAGELRVQRCTACATWVHPPQYRCLDCGSADLAWTPMSGRGQLFTWAVTHRSFHPAFADDLPFVTAVVQLDEGPRIVTMLRRLEAGQLVDGLRVRAEFEPRQDGTRAVVFVAEEAS
jgi:uncharacterized OB-fold protein